MRVTTKNIEIELSKKEVQIIESLYKFDGEKEQEYQNVISDYVSDYGTDIDVLFHNVDVDSEFDETGALIERYISGEVEMRVFFDGTLIESEVEFKIEGSETVYTQNQFERDIFTSLQETYNKY